MHYCQWKQDSPYFLSQYWTVETMRSNSKFCLFFVVQKKKSIFDDIWNIFSFHERFSSSFPFTDDSPHGSQSPLENGSSAYHHHISCNQDRAISIEYQSAMIAANDRISAFENGINSGTLLPNVSCNVRNFIFNSSKTCKISSFSGFWNRSGFQFATNLLPGKRKAAFDRLFLIFFFS